MQRVISSADGCLYSISWWYHLWAEMSKRDSETSYDKSQQQPRWHSKPITFQNKAHPSELGCCNRWIIKQLLQQHTLRNSSYDRIFLFISFWFSHPQERKRRWWTLTHDQLRVKIWEKASQFKEAITTNVWRGEVEKKY